MRPPVGLVWCFRPAPQTQHMAYRITFRNVQECANHLLGYYPTLDKALEVLNNELRIDRLTSVLNLYAYRIEEVESED